MNEKVEFTKPTQMNDVDDKSWTSGLNALANSNF